MLPAHVDVPMARRDSSVSKRPCYGHPLRPTSGGWPCLCRATWGLMVRSDETVGCLVLVSFGFRIIIIDVLACPWLCLIFQWFYEKENVFNSLNVIFAWICDVYRLQRQPAYPISPVNGPSGLVPNRIAGLAFNMCNYQAELQTTV